MSGGAKHSRTYRERHPERARAANAAWRVANNEYDKQRQAEWSRKRLSKEQRIHTPIAFRDMLLDLARRIEAAK